MNRILRSLAFFISSVVILGAQEPLPEATLVQGQSPSSRPSLRVADFGLPEFDPATARVLNLNQMTSSTLIRNNVMRPYMRN